MDKDSIRDCCDTNEPHAGPIKRAREAMPRDEDLAALSELFKSLADNTRVRILAALQTEELCVCDLAALLDMSQSAVSHQLRLLRGAHLVRFRRDGKNVFYSLDDQHVSALFKQGLEHVRHE